jgi:hypothetical protein
MLGGEVRAAREGELAGAPIPRSGDYPVATPSQPPSRPGCRLRHHCACRYSLVAITPARVTQANALVLAHLLRAYDALHLACALAVWDTLQPCGLPTPLCVTTDDALLTAARAEGSVVDTPRGTPQPCPERVVHGRPGAAPVHRSRCGDVPHPRSRAPHGSAPSGGSAATATLYGAGPRRSGSHERRAVRCSDLTRVMGSVQRGETPWTILFQHACTTSHG